MGRRRERRENATHSALLITCGNGCEGSIVTGVRSGSDLPHVVKVDLIFFRVIESCYRQNTDSFSRESGKQRAIPAVVLVRHKGMQLGSDTAQLFFRAETIRTGISVSVFHLLEEPSQPNFDEFVKVAGSDCQKLHSLKKRIASILRFFEHAPVECQPRLMAVDIETRTVQCDARHCWLSEKATECYRKSVNGVLQGSISHPLHRYTQPQFSTCLDRFSEAARRIAPVLSRVFILA